VFPDTVHPNNEGAKIIAATIYHSLIGRRILDLLFPRPGSFFTKSVAPPSPR
jgi:hypothetical protein